MLLERQKINNAIDPVIRIVKDVGVKFLVIIKTENAAMDIIVAKFKVLISAR